MKRMVSIILAAIIIFALSVPVYAGEKLTTEETANIDVYAKGETDLPPNVRVATVVNGRAEFVTVSGLIVTLTISDSSLNGLSAILIEIDKSEKEAFAWLSRLLGTDDFFAFYVIFKDKNGNEIKPNASITVSITKPNQYSVTYAYNISKNGQVTSLGSYIMNGRVVFNVSGLSYFAITNKKIGDDSIASVVPPPTGDDRNITLFLTMMLISILFMLGAAQRTTRGRRRLSA